MKIYIKISNFVRKLFKKSVLIKRKLPPKSKIFEFLYSLFFFEDVNLSSFCSSWDLNHSSFYPSRDVNLSSFYPPGDVNLSSLCPSWDLTMSYFRVTHFSCICYWYKLKFDLIDFYKDSKNIWIYPHVLLSVK